MEGKRPVWILFRLLELIFSVAICILHMKCVAGGNSEHIFVLCTTAGGGTIFAVLGLLSLFISSHISLRNEAICSGIFGLLCLFSTYMNMHMGTKDRIQPFLMNHELAVYGVLWCCKSNATVLIYTASIYLLHCSLATDMLMTHPLQSVGGNTPILPPRGKQRPLQLYFISKEVENHLKNYRWFQLFTTNVTKKTTEIIAVRSDRNTSQTVTNM